MARSGLLTGFFALFMSCATSQFAGPRRLASYKFRSCTMLGIENHYDCLIESWQYCDSLGLERNCASDEPEGIDPGSWLPPLDASSPAYDARIK